MNAFEFLRPKPTLSDQEISHGLRMMTWEGMVSMGFFSITTSGILAAYALALGANNFQIGILAAIPFIMQPIQIPAILLVEKLRRRKAISVIAWFLAQSLWLPVALIPVFIGVPSNAAISVLLVLMAIRGVFAAVTNCSWNPWVRDLVPQQILGRFYSRRLALSVFVAIVFGLGAAFFVDYWHGQVSQEIAILGYTYAILFGAVSLGLTSVVFMSFIPEPLMQPEPEPRQSLIQRLFIPFRDPNFRRLMQFLFSWSFVLNLAIPFFAVYMLRRLGLPLSWVIGLSAISQLFNILFLRVWGPLVDRFGSKAILSISASLYLLVVVGWTFTTMPGRHFLTIPLLIILHTFAGVAAAGVTLTVGTIGMKLAPQQQATPYLAGATLATSLGAGLGPLAGGFLADFFSVRQLSLVFSWFEPNLSVELPTVSLSGFDFLFGITFVVGLITLSILATVHEEGEVGREVILESLTAPVREFSRPLSSVPGLNLMNNFAFGHLKRIPIPGLDVAFGVTAYEIADMARIATLAATRGRRVTKQFVRTLRSELNGILKSKEQMKIHGVEVTKQIARGAMHSVSEKPLESAQLVASVMSGVVTASKQTGVDAEDTILGVSQGIIQGTAETEADLGTAALQIMETAKEITEQAGLSEEVVMAKAVEGTLLAAEAIGPEAVAEVTESLPDEILALGDKRNKQ